MLVADQPRISLQPEGVSPVHEFLRVLNRQRVLLLGVAAAVAAVIILVAGALPPRYTATAVVSVLPGAPDPLQPQSTVAAVGDDDVATQAELLSTRDVAAEVVAQTGYGLASEPSRLTTMLCRVVPSRPSCHPAPPTFDGRVGAFMAHLTVTPKERGGLIDLSLTDRDPAIAAKALNTLITVFQQDQIAARTEALNRTAAWLTQRADALRAKWMQASQKAAAYRSRYGLTTGAAPGADMPVTSQETSHAASDYAAAEADLESAEARQAALHQAGAAGADDPALVAQLSALEVQQAQLSAEHGPGYPADDAIARQIAVARGQLAAARARAVREADTEVAAKRAAVAALSQNLDTLQGHAGTLGMHEGELARLDNDARSAQTIYEEFLARTTELDERADLIQPTIQFASHAVAPGAPSFPNRPRLALAGIVLGLLAGIGAVLAREHMSRGFSNVSRIGQDLALPLLCTIPLVTGRRDRGAIARYIVEHPLSEAAEAMRGLAMQIELAGETRGQAPVRSLAITSATGREGKTTSCLWLATALARSGQRVLLIDGDHRRGTIAEQLGGHTSSGIAELVGGVKAAADMIQHAKDFGFDFISAGRPMSHAFGAAELRRLRDLMRELTTRYDMVLIDTPPLLALSDALAYANVADRSVMMCLWRSTTRQAVASCLERLEAAGANMLGICLTMVDGDRMPMFSDELRHADTRLLAGYYTVQ